MHTAPHPGVTRYPLGEDTVLFIHHSGRLVLLNPTADLVLRGLESGLQPSDIIDVLNDSAGNPASSSEDHAAHVARDVHRVITILEEAGAWSATVERRPGGVAQHRAETERSADRLSPKRPEPRSQSESSVQRRYRLADLRFELRTASPQVDRLTQDLLGHLIDPADPSQATERPTDLEVVEAHEGWLLRSNGTVKDRCLSFDGVAPMLHANILLMAYWVSDCMAAIHAAAVTHRSDCILMPGTSGSGKSTLTAALLAAGFGYCTDDLALLTHAPVRLQPVPSCLGLKTGSWALLADRYPDLRDRPAHLRADDRWVKYLPPPVSADLVRSRDTHSVSSIVFPVRSSGTEARLLEIRPADALVRLTMAGYDLPKPIDKDTVECLIGWISDLPCFELQFDRLDQAVHQMTRLP